MEDLSALSDPEEIRQKIKIIEGIPTGASLRAGAVLVLLG